MMHTRVTFLSFSPLSSSLRHVFFETSRVLSDFNFSTFSSLKASSTLLQTRASVDVISFFIRSSCRCRDKEDDNNEGRQLKKELKIHLDDDLKRLENSR